VFVDLGSHEGADANDWVLVIHMAEITAFVVLLMVLLWLYVTLREHKRLVDSLRAENRALRYDAQADTSRPKD
jgi:hypothetical protein